MFAELKAAHEAGVLERYALGGAVGATVYLEPAATEDVDIFVTIRTPAGSRLTARRSRSSQRSIWPRSRLRRIVSRTRFG